MRIIGIDPGIGRAGWGVIENQKSVIKTQNYGCIETPKTFLITDRLKLLYDDLKKILLEQKPDVMAIEDLFFNTNAKTALLVGQARGVVLLAAAEQKIPVFIYTPLQVKIAITGYGRAEKLQIGRLVKVILKLSSIPKPDDTADALAIALTHIFTLRYK